MYSFWTLIHGMGFGALYLLGCSGAIVELYRFSSGDAAQLPTIGRQRFVQAYMVVMVALAWVTVLTGAYIIYPWYRAIPAAGAIDLTGYAQRLLMSHPSTIGWHSIGMEWKEHIAWVVPISITMAAFVVIRYGAQLRLHKQLRTAVLSFTAASFLAAGIAGFFGAMIDKYAPVQGGPKVQLLHGDDSADRR
jgi:hypothetical protein